MVKAEFEIIKLGFFVRFVCMNYGDCLTALFIVFTGGPLNKL